MRKRDVRPRLVELGQTYVDLSVAGRFKAVRTRTLVHDRAAEVHATAAHERRQAPREQREKLRVVVGLMSVARAVDGVLDSWH